MEHFNNFLWGAFPWLAIAAFFVGIFWRWRTDQFGWTTHSSQIYESKLLRLSSPLFHWGMVFVVIGHLMGLAMPKSWTRAVGISDHAYHLIATIPGSIAAVAVVLGFCGLLYRRIVNRSVFLSTSKSDKVMYVFLGLALLSGTIATFSTQVFGGPQGYDYRETISPWLRDLIVFNIHPETMVDVPWQFKLHVLAGFTIIAVWPYTRLVHAFSAPVGYVTRPYVVYRSRDSRATDMRRHVAWEPVRNHHSQLDKSETPSHGA
ncbi:MULTISPECIES: respiratory nitrate reductase subunit gamma [Corynebacterium]|uniref:Nitrate reductase-like protein NarX n=1 Tax=Corynebacterium phoceense TaxID=1686286 RepID=A0A540R7L4_9CORY|nr:MULTISPECIES: respiratory nitrate reductase subunit gamma [Corynebacterium]KXB54316.1 respiratory nitrate reductase, gamma subunit [Corynebacterium sp. DNF00584]MBF9010445.1 respiratory nitrate reductase subunit gamma [Corynebacterium phoceense]MCQ9330141.1 respiratory nitrate reductase subunit gamma [Corynebacterium phoceense]MCQ9340153.1 respiratory nitrate reductase subunit gamma [Corynebacterium phoceense]MCQ9346571.1 respiratory nitrate reductase subunit gamma [Corynebacterium phoceens